MIGLFFTLAIVAAVAAVGIRRLRARRAEQQRPGATLRGAVVVASFDEIDAAIQDRRCRCGGWYALAGETSRTVGARRFRISRLTCKECGRDAVMYFDVTLVFH